MKKLLFASTALVLSTGVAAANNNISFSGDARMGVVYNSANAAPVAKTQWSARARMTITMKRTTDSGMEVGAVFRVDQGGVAVGNTAMSGGRGLPVVPRSGESLPPPAGCRRESTCSRPDARLGLRRVGAKRASDDRNATGIAHRHGIGAGAVGGGLRPWRPVRRR